MKKLSRQIGIAMFSLLISALAAHAVPSSTIEWNPVTVDSSGNPLSGLSFYRLYISTKSMLSQTTSQALAAGAATTSIATSLGSQTTSYVFASYTLPTTYYFRLSAIDNSGNESVFNVDSTTLLDVQLSTFYPSNVLFLTSYTECGLSVDPTNAAHANFFVLSTDTGFPSLPTLSAQATGPSGPKSLTLTRLSSAPLIYTSNVASTTFANSDYFNGPGTFWLIMIGTSPFSAGDQGYIVLPALGGAVVDSATVAEASFQPGSVSTISWISMGPEPVDTGGLRAAALARQGLVSLGPGRNFVLTTSGTMTTALVTMPFNSGLVPVGIATSTAKLAYFNPNTSAWELVSLATVYSNYLTASVTHFSLYAPVIQALDANATAPGLRNVYAYPNPAVGSQIPTIRALVGMVNSVEVTIFNSAGRKVYSGTMNGSPTGVYNGEYYYDLPWNGPKATGVYYAVIHAHAADGSIIKARHAFAVVH